MAQSASNLHPGRSNRAEGDLARGRIAGRSFSGRSSDEDVDLLPDEGGKLVWREFVDRLQHPRVHALGRVSGQ